VPTASRDLPGVLDELERWGAERDWLGADPYEGMNAPLARIARTRKMRQAVTQAYRRFPVTPPPPLHAKPRRNAKAVALVLSGYAAHDFPGGAEQRARCVEQLRTLNMRSAPAAAWGYHFDFQSRWGRYGAGDPNAIATCFAVGALIDAGEPELALAARPFLADDLWQDEDIGPYFGYVGHGAVLIHNANAMICGALARLHEIEPDDEIAGRVRRATATTAGFQRSDGSWPYGEGRSLGWVDNFHTGYTLEGLYEVERVLGGGSEAIARGYEYWNRELFTPDGRARARNDRLYPLEAHSFATAIDTLVVLRERFPDAVERATRIADAAVRELWLPRRRYFAFERWARWTNRRAFVRWTNAPMFRALARLAEFS
jgi:hypothetical protein